MKYYGKIGSAEQIIVSSTTYVPPTDYIPLDGERPTPHHIATSNGTWELSNDLLKQEVEQQKQQLLVIARNNISDLEIIIEQQNHNSDDDDTPVKRNLTAWRQYLVDLYGIEQQQGYPATINWPEQPTHTL